MRDDIYRESINISRKKNDKQKIFFKIGHDVLKECGGHERDQIKLYGSSEYPYMNYNIEIEPVWSFTFYTKNLQNRHKKIFKKLQLKFPDRNIYCPDEESGQRLFLKKLANCVFEIRDFIDDINVQRLNEKEKEYFQKMKQKYKFVFESNNDVRHSIQELMKKQGLSGLIKKFDITSYLKKLENNSEINTNETQKAVDNILEILNTELFISQFKWMYKDTNVLWKEKFDWHLFEPNDYVDSLKIPTDNKEFNSQLQYLYKILVESLNNKELTASLRILGVKDTELKNEKGEKKKSISLLELWITRKMNEDNLEIIEFLKLLNKLRGKTEHSLKIDVSKKEEFQKIVEFCKKKQPIKSYIPSEVFKAILKTSEVLLEKKLCHPIK